MYLSSTLSSSQTSVTGSSVLAVVASFTMTNIFPGPSTATRDQRIRIRLVTHKLIQRSSAQVSRQSTCGPKSLEDDWSEVIPLRPGWCLASDGGSVWISAGMSTRSTDPHIYLEKELQDMYCLLLYTFYSCKTNIIACVRTMARHSRDFQCSSRSFVITCISLKDQVSKFGTP